MPKKSAKKSTPAKSTKAVKKSAKAATKPANAVKKSAKSVTKDVKGRGRPDGATNFVPTNDLEVRDTGKFKAAFVEGIVGPRWIRIYAKDQINSQRLLVLQNLIDAQDKDLLKLLDRHVKAL